VDGELRLNNKADTHALDVITLGRSSIDLYGEQIGGRLEAMASFAKYVGGSPTNTAIGARRLGLRSGLITRVGADHMGRFILDELEREGVDTAGVRTDPERLTALAILGIVDQETFPLVFYRENCADMAIDSADIDPAWLLSSKALLIGGTHLSEPKVYRASLDLAIQIKDAGGKVVLDVDYRPVLWGLTPKDMGEQRYIKHSEVTERLLKAAALCDLILGTEEEMRILGGEDDLMAALKSVRSVSNAVLVCKRSELGCVIFAGAIGDRLDEGISVPAFPVEILNVLGAGDAFAAGFLRGWLRDEAWERCGLWGNACGAIVVARHGCAPAMPTFDELQSFIAMHHPLSEPETRALAHQHWAQTRRRKHDTLMVLAMDHRLLLEELAQGLGASVSRISDFKRLALKAVHEVARGNPDFGVLLDGRLGAQALREATQTDYWVGRPIEVPKSRPLRFEAGPDVGLELNTWPAAHVVKCLVLYHPDDEPWLRDEQERQLLTLFDACRKSRHELLLELILPEGLASDSRTRGRALSRLYELGIKPDWWKLEPLLDPESWKHVESVIDAYDPYCRGVVLLGAATAEDGLRQAFRVAAPFKCVRGFAVGRTIFADVASDWLRGAIDERGACELMAARLEALSSAWLALKAHCAHIQQDGMA
jgi:5-dehydro-2-deoxygluconokinase